MFEVNERSWQCSVVYLTGSVTESLSAELQYYFWRHLQEFLTRTFHVIVTSKMNIRLPLASH